MEKISRMTFTIDDADRRRLERIAQMNDVSIAWLLRKAVRSWLDDVEAGKQLPLDLNR